MFLAAQEAKVQIPWNGLEGWFFNLSHGSAVKWAVKGLEAIGAAKASQVVQSALSVFPEGLAPEDDHSFQSCLNGLSPDQKSLLDALDSQFYDADDDLDQLSLRWLQANREVFRQARGI